MLVESGHDSRIRINQSYHFIKSHPARLKVLLLVWTIAGPLSANYVHCLPIFSTDASNRSPEPIKLEEAFLGELRARDFDFDWLSTKAAGESEIYDQLVYEESKNILLATLPSIERRNGSSIFQTSIVTAKHQQSSNNFQPNITVLVSNTSLLSSIEFQGYKISPSKRYLLLWNAKRKQFRHSSTAKYFLYDIERELISLLSTKDAPEDVVTSSMDDENEFLRFQMADWYATETPDGSLDSLVLIQNNDIYSLYDVSRLINQRKVSPVDSKGASNGYARPRRVTFTGREGVIFNGVPDWLYEEEILGETPAFQVSPASNHLAYLAFNDSAVNIMPLTIYGDRVIPRIQLIRYPKTGQPNPKVTVHIVENLDQVSGYPPFVRDFQMDLPADLSREQHYINRINWLTDERLALIWSNRNQNYSVVVVCALQPAGSSSHDRWKCEKNLEMKANNGWLDINDDLSPLNSDHYLALIPKFEGPEVGFFKHIAKVSLKEPNSFVYITSGAREVTYINGIDYKRSLVYYTSTVANKPNQRHLFVAELDNKSTQSSAALNAPETASSSVCVTCEHHSDCTYNFAKMSPSTNYYMFHCFGPGIPRTELRATRRRRHRNFFENLVNDTRQRKLLGQFDSLEFSVPAAPGDSLSSQNSPSLLFTFEDNKKLRDKLENRTMPLAMRLHVPIQGTDYLAQVSLLLPPSLSALLNATEQQQAGPSNYLSLNEAGKLFMDRVRSGIKYPMVVDVYGGPGSQKVDDRFGINFGYYLASSEQMIYAMIDGRGSGYQGSKRLYELYHRLGTVEIQDQMDVAAQLAKSLWFIDSSRIAIWGWSYGGYAAAMSLAQSKKRARDQNPAQSSAVVTSGSTFKCAASVAPVTNWIYYDTAYTERYMSSPWLNEEYDDSSAGDHLASQIVLQPQRSCNPLTPNKWTPLNQTLRSNHIRHHLAQQLLELITAEQPEVNRSIHERAATASPQTTNKMMDLNERYRGASLLEHAANIEPNSFLLVHGTADDNVNFQQSIMLMKRLIKKNVQFESRLYPDQDHGIAEKADKLHLGITLSKFLIQCLG